MIGTHFCLLIFVVCSKASHITLERGVHLLECLLEI